MQSSFGSNAKRPGDGRRTRCCRTTTEEGARTKAKQDCVCRFWGQEGEVLFGVTEELRLEGVIAKRRDSIYRVGKTRDWLKIKTAVGKEREARRFEDR